MRTALFARPRFFLLYLLLSLNAQADSGITTYSGAGNGARMSIDNGVVTVNGLRVSGQMVSGQGAAKTEVRALSGFSGISMLAPVSLTYVASHAPSIQVTAPPNILPLLVTSVENGQLVISLIGSVSLRTPVIVNVEGEMLELLTMMGAGQAQLNGLSGQVIRLHIAGTGNIAATGNVERLEAKMSGAGNIDTTGTRAMQVAIDVSGSGDVHAYASQSVQVDISGAGNVTISGNPAQRSINRSGSGSVRFVE